MEKIIKEIQKEMEELNTTIMNIRANNKYQEILYSKIFDCLDELDRLNGIEGDEK